MAFIKLLSILKDCNTTLMFRLFSLASLKDFFMRPAAAAIIVFVSLTPTFWVVSRYCSMAQKLAQLEEDLLAYSSVKAHAEKRKAEQLEILKKIGGAMPSYTDSSLSSIMLLVPEVKKWQSLSSDDKPAKAVQERLSFLEGEQNKITFITSSPIMEEGLKVCEKKQRSPVEMGADDLKKVLTIIEGHPIGPYTPAIFQPQLIIKELQLCKKVVPVLKEKVYLVSMTLLEREKASGHPL
jgi:hypothetical protein